LALIQKQQISLHFQLDIPVYKSRIQSLHVLFTLYSAFKNSQHFNQLARDNNMDNDKNGFDRLEF
jgi:hypothetical protein